MKVRQREKLSPSRKGAIDSQVIGSYRKAKDEISPLRALTKREACPTL